MGVFNSSSHGCNYRPSFRTTEEKAVAVKGYRKVHNVEEGAGDGLAMVA